MRTRMDTKKEHQITQRKVLIWLSVLVMATGLVFYIAWGLLYGSWNMFDRENLGVYAVTIVMVGYGFLGIIINNRKLRQINEQ